MTLSTDWPRLVDISLRHGRPLCTGHLQTVLSRDWGESIQGRRGYQDSSGVRSLNRSILLSPVTNTPHVPDQCLWVKSPLLFLTTHRDEKNILEAASSGASASIGLVANIAANLIAFLAILAFINEALSWLGGMVGYPSITFQVLPSNTQ